MIRLNRNHGETFHHYRDCHNNVPNGYREVPLFFPTAIKATMSRLIKSCHDFIETGVYHKWGDTPGAGGSHSLFPVFLRRFRLVSSIHAIQDKPGEFSASGAHWTTCPPVAFNHFAVL